MAITGAVFHIGILLVELLRFPFALTKSDVEMCKFLTMCCGSDVHLTLYMK